MNTALRVLSGYSNLGEKAQQLLSSHLEERTISLGQKICSLSEPTVEMYFAEKGTFHVKKRNYTTIRNYIIHAKNSSFIHFGAYNDPTNSNVEIVALDKVTILVLPYHTLEILAFENDEINALYTRLLCHNFRSYSSQYNAISATPISESKWTMKEFVHRISKFAASIM